MRRRRSWFGLFNLVGASHKGGEQASWIGCRGGRLVNAGRELVRRLHLVMLMALVLFVVFVFVVVFLIVLPLGLLLLLGRRLRLRVGLGGRLGLLGRGRWQRSLGLALSLSLRVSLSLGLTLALVMALGRRLQRLPRGARATKLEQVEQTGGAIRVGPNAARDGRSRCRRQIHDGDKLRIGRRGDAMQCR